MMFANTKSFFSWFSRVCGFLFEPRVGLAVFVVGAGIVARATSLIAFLIPLKVLLLASADGVPSYSQGFITPETKNEWIIGLSIAALALYAISLVADFLADRLAARGGKAFFRRRVTVDAENILQDPDQQEKIKAHYSTSCAVLSDSIFAFVATLVILLINFPLAVYLLLVLSLLYWVSFSSFQKREKERGVMAELISEDLGAYLKLVSSVTFLTGFFVVLLPYVSGEGPSLLRSIVSIILLRQLLSALSSSVKSLSKFYRSSEKIEALLFEPEADCDEGELRDSFILHKFIDVESRKVCIEPELLSMGINPESLRASWADSPIQNVVLVNLVDVGAEEKGPLFQLRIYDKSSRHYMEGELYLLEHLESERVNLPPALGIAEVDGSCCKVLDFQNFRQVTDMDEYRLIQAKVVELQWSIIPCESLVNASGVYNSAFLSNVSHLSLEELKFAADSSEAKLIFARLQALWPAILEFLDMAPVYIHNRLWTIENVLVEDRTSLPAFAAWDRWSIEPLGYRLPKGIKRSSLESILGRLRCLRRDVDESFTVDSLLLVNSMAKFYEAFRRRRYAESLLIARNVVANRLFVRACENA